MSSHWVAKILTLVYDTFNMNFETFHENKFKGFFVKFLCKQNLKYSENQKSVE